MNQPEHVDPEDLRPYIGQWVALDTSGKKERIVGNGTNAVEAVKSATDAGYKDACLLFVPSGPFLATPFVHLKGMHTTDIIEVGNAASTTS